LVVAGYSGRDDSIMDALQEALKQPSAFPTGLFWLHRGEGSPLPQVGQLLTTAVSAKIEVGLVPVENFDEAMRDLVRLVSAVDTKALDSFAAERRRWSGAPRPAGGRTWPVVRLNALPVVQAPSVCRRVVCRIGGHTEARKAVELAGVDVLVARTRAGVLAFGSDKDVRASFEANEITSFDLHTIETKRLRYDSGERGLLRSALTRSIARQRDLDVMRRGSRRGLSPMAPTFKELAALPVTTVWWS
jgi:hypothetical protein